MSEELKQAISALQCAKRGHCDHAMADEAIAALEALTQRPAAQAVEREAFEAWARDRGYQYDELDRCRIGIVGSEYYNANTEMAWQAYQAGRASLPTQPAAQEMPDAVEHYGTVDDLPAAQATPEPDDAQRRFEAGCVVLEYLRDIGAPYRAVHHMLIALHGDPEAKSKATPEPVGEVFQFPPMPEGWPARFRCDSCDGNGEIGELVSTGHFQPPERQTCPDCGGRGWTSEEHAFNADHMREFAEAHALLTRPAPGVPEGFALVPVEPTLEMWQSVNQFAHAGSVWESMLAAAQAKGDDK